MKNETILLQEAKLLQEELVCIRRHLHAHPETGFDLQKTKSYVKQQLLSMGYEPTDCGKCGITATIGDAGAKNVFLLRADMDALPITEEAKVEFASQNGKMHACGHDMHTTMLLGAAKLLKSHEAKLHGSVKFMFQPAEEIFEGSKDMIQSEVLKNPTVDAALMIHVMANLALPAGTAIVCDGGISAPAADYFSIKVQGKGCHGSMPNTGIDPIYVAAHIITALEEIQTRELALSEDAVLTFGTIHGGNAENVIPDTVELGGTLRTYDEETRSFIKQRITEISHGIAASFRASSTVTFGSGCPTLVNDPALSQATIQYMKELLGNSFAYTARELNVKSGNQRTAKATGSEDFAYISQEIPSIMIALAAGHPDEGFCYPQHHPKVVFDESVLSYGSAIYAYTALRWLMDSSKK